MSDDDLRAFFDGRDVDAIAARFWPKVDWTGGPSSCWWWRSSVSGRYGQFSIYDGRREQAHRLAWMLFNRLPFPKGMYACHRCDAPTCVNPAHIFVGTQADNLRDASRKGRLWCFGSKRKEQACA
jgi:hypothetical protein